MRIEKDQLIVIGLMVTMGLTFALGVWRPAQARRGELNRKTSELETRLSKVRNTTRGLTQWRERVDLLARRLEGAQQYVPQQNEQGQVIRGVNQALNRFGVSNQEMVIKPTVQGPKFSVIPITLEYQSSFPVVYRSLKRIEQMPRLVRVERLSVQADPRRPAEPAEVYLELNTFFSQADVDQSDPPKGGRS